MDLRTVATVFLSVFLSELGDKTQLATLLFASQEGFNKVGVFIASASALVLTSFIAVLVGDQVSRFVPLHTVKIVAGIGFITIGLWVFISART
ncbi:MAG: TMEM165/GDT1 family protein [bacterium]